MDKHAVGTSRGPGGAGAVAGGDSAVTPVAPVDDATVAVEELLAETLVEEVSIDGMCGVY